MDKLKMMSMDKVQGNIEKIRALFPNAVTEVLRDGKPTLAVDFDVLKQELADTLIDGRELRYQFTWPDKQKAILRANEPTNKTLRPCREESVDFDTTQNLYIEGDNLEVLKLLQETYLGKIKMIYIDPPYNTGNDFVYNDDFVKDSAEYKENSGQFDEDGNNTTKSLMENYKQNLESNGRFHTDWLNMIYPRLKLAKDLLAEDGVIFISIDDNEVENLKKICDEIFSASNFRSTITVIANPGGRDYGGIAKTTEYILVYAKSENSQITKVNDDAHVFERKDQYGPFELRELRNRNTVFNDKNRPNLCYPFFIDPNDIDEYGLFHVALEKDERHTVEVMPLISQGIQTVWRWGKEEKSRKNLNINIKGKRKADGTFMIVEKYRDEKVMVKNIWLDKKFRTENGSVQIRELFGNKTTFSYPKPMEIPYLVSEMCTQNDDIILDFFSGSATTAHAVMQLNAKDGGNRKFIMVQLPELCDKESEAYKAGYKNICEIGKERIRRAGRKIKEENGLTAQNLDIGFRVFKLDSSNMQDVYYKPEDYSQTLLDNLQDNIKPDRTALDLLFQVMLELGKPLSAKITQKVIAGKNVFNVDDGDLIACFEDNITAEIVTEIAKAKPLYAVFRDSGLSSDSVAANFEQIFATYSPSTKRKVL